jgi:hypothetical protein
VSGIKVYGEQRAAAFADYDGDARVDLAVSQNGAETVLYHNEGGTPGIRVRLLGPPANPDAVGGMIRVVYPERMGPVREIQSGSGFWSHNGAVQVLGVGPDALAVWIRWPDGSETEIPIRDGQVELVVNFAEHGVSGE